MSNEIKEKEDKSLLKKLLTEENLQLVANVIITTVSTAALAISIATGMKGKRKS